MTPLLLATTNPGKLRELHALLEDLPLQLLTPSDLSLELSVVEDGETFLDNARKKAHAFAEAAGLPALADDSGLEVDALDGAPGVASARWHPGSDEDRLNALLARLEPFPPAARAARYRAVVVLARPGDPMSAWTEATVEGRIANTPRGREGFGYDPAFLVEDGPHTGDLTMAELPPPAKNELSHRARAVTALLPSLQALAQP